ncbi:hypothetical protein [uncultured Oxalicibacterium sp.]|nr:hypothetical protein [uncultured Oxalicibacterium sp.]
MNALLYALCVFALPLWVFWGLHLFLEFRDQARAQQPQKEDDI